MLNDNFEIGCCDDMDDCILEPLYDDLNEISYIKEFATISNYDTFKYFLSKDMKEKIVQTFQEKISALNKNDCTFEAKKEYFKEKLDKRLDVKKKKKKT